MPEKNHFHSISVNQETDQIRIILKGIYSVSEKKELFKTFSAWAL